MAPPTPSPPAQESRFWWGWAYSLTLLLQVDQAGLFLPSRDYYLNRTANEKVRSNLRTSTPTLSWDDLCLLFPLPGVGVRVGNASLSCHLVTPLPFLPFFSLYFSSLPSFLLCFLPFLPSLPSISSPSLPASLLSFLLFFQENIL